MRHVMNWVICCALLACTALTGSTSTAIAAVQEGNWSVLIITEKGQCDRGYRYEVKVANGRVTYRGEAAINLAGTVAPDGATKVSIKVGEKGASGTGHLSENTGAGIWRGVGANGTCAGRWEAELE
jgi:hypothetical protein